MKTILLMLALISTSVLASGNHSHSSHGHGHDHAKLSKRKTLQEFEKNEVLNVLKANEDLHASFFEYNGKKVEKSAKELSKLMGKISNKEIAKMLKFSKDRLLVIKSDAKKKDNYQSYHMVSMALIYVLNKYDLGSKYNAYSCPMVKMKWVQNSKKMNKVHNPYAANMKHCGTKDTKF